MPCSAAQEKKDIHRPVTMAHHAKLHGQAVDTCLYRPAHCRATQPGQGHRHPEACPQQEPLQWATLLWANGRD